jgi:hypothetical protein
MANLYKKFDATDVAKNRDGGYKALIWFAPVDKFLVLQQPTGTPTLLGDTKKITTAHTFGATDGFYSLLCKMHSVKSKTTSIGDDGVKQLEHEFEGIITGDSASHLEQFEDMLNDQLVILIKDQDCINATDRVQFGDSCLQPTLTIEFDSADTNTGVKTYKVSGKIRGHKYFYSGTVTEATA